jgi:RimJ/RimL family protein N-acetyltransferase
MKLREVVDDDLDELFAQQVDPESYTLADLPPRERPAFDAHWARIRSDPDVTIRTIDLDGRVAGHVLSFERAGMRLVGYWLGREHWGNGLATEALAGLLEIETRRPLHAQVAKANRGSIRVLEKNGFRCVGEGTDGFVYELSDSKPRTRP